jgi:hypothetical protein
MIVYDTRRKKYIKINKNDFKNEAKYYEYIVRCKFDEEIVQPPSCNEIRNNINALFANK